MKQFTLYGNTITRTTQQENYNTIRLDFLALSKQARRDFLEEYKLFRGDMKSVEANIYSCGMRYIRTGVKTCMSYLQHSEVYDLDEDQFLHTYGEYSIKIWKTSRDAAFSGYTTSGEYSQQRAVVNDYNLHTKGFMKAMGDSMLSGVGRGFEEITYGRRSDVTETLANGIARAVMALSSALMQALKERANVRSEVPSENAVKTTLAYANNLAQGNVPEEKRLDLLLEALQLDPYSDKIYQVGFDLFGDADGELEAYEKHFGGSTLAAYKGEKIEKQIKDLPLKFDLEAEPARETVRELCAAYGTDAAPHLQSLEKRIEGQQKRWEKEHQARDKYFTVLQQYKSKEELEQVCAEAKEHLAECTQNHEGQIREDPALLRLHNVQKCSVYAAIAGALIAVFFVVMDGNWLSPGMLLFMLSIAVYWYMGKKKNDYIQEHGSEAVKNSQKAQAEAKQRVQELEAMQNAIKSYTSQYGEPPVTMEEWEKTAPDKAMADAAPPAADDAAKDTKDAEPAAEENAETAEQPAQSE